MLLTNKMQFLTKKQLAGIFFNGCKSEKKIGIESEKLLVYKKDYRAIDYKTASKILENFCTCGWEKIGDGNFTAIKGEKGTITLEPGSQVEISLKPLETLNEITIELNEFYKNLSVFAKNSEAIVLDYGIQPAAIYKDINIIPKKRYEFMTKYLPLKQLEPYIMMRETAGIQVNFDYESEEDAIKKLALSLKLSPIISAIYSNSPIRAKKLTGYKSYRAYSWLMVDEDRCGFISKKLFDKNLNFTFSDYVEVLLDVPMIFIQRGNKYYGTTQTFRDFMQNGCGNLKAGISDWENHISLYFPDVRLKSYIEIRNHDAQNSKMTFSVPAFWKGIIYNNDAMKEIEKILSKFDYEDFMQLRQNSPKEGIRAKLKKFEIIDLIKEFFDISYYSLKSSKLNEEKYLEAVYEYITSKRVPADDVIDKFNNNKLEFI